MSATQSNTVTDTNAAANANAVITNEDDYNRIVNEYGSPKRNIALVMIAAIGLYIMCMTLSTCLSLRIAAIAPDQKNDFYSSMVAIGSFVILFATPLSGAISDRTTSRFGRRRPWILGYTLVALVCFAIVGLINNMIVIGIAYVIGITAMQCGFTCYQIIPVEGIPDRYRGRVMGFMGMFGALAVSFGSFLAGALVTQPLLLMTAPILLGLVTAIPLLIMYKDPQRSADQVPPLDFKELFGHMIVNPRKHPSYALVWVTRALTGFGMAAMFSYFAYYLIDGLHFGVTEVGSKIGMLTLMSAPVSIIFFTASGWISDRIGRRKPLVILAGVTMAVALIIGGTSHTFTQFIVAWLIFAVGQAMYLTVDLALCAAVLPDSKDAGKDMGMFQVALSIGNMAAPAVAPMLLKVGATAGPNYLFFWAVSAVICLVAAAMMPLLKGVK